MIEKLRSQRATWHTVEREAAEGDRVDGRLRGHDRRRVVRGRARQGCRDRHRLRASFAGLRRGVFAGSKPAESATATVLFPQDYPTKSLAGKTAVFAIDVKKVEERQLPELDDEFAESFGLAGGAGSLRGEVRNNMERELKERLRAETKTRAFDALIDANRIVRAACARRPGDQRAAGRCVAPDGQQRPAAGAASRAFRGNRFAPRDRRALDSRASAGAQDQARRSAARATHQGAGGARTKSPRKPRSSTAAIVA